MLRAALDNRRVLPRLLAMVMGLAAMGCGRGVTEHDVPGVYRAVYSYGTEQLTIREDGTYEQAFGEKRDAVAVINRGRWELRRGDIWNRTQLVLHNPVSVDDGSGRKSDLKRFAFWVLPVRRSWSGEIRVPINEDLGLTFEKIR